MKPITPLLAGAALVAGAVSSAGTAGGSPKVEEKRDYSAEDLATLELAGAVREPGAYRISGPSKDTVVRDDGWVEHQYKEPLRNGHTFTVKGDLRDGRCHFTGDKTSVGNERPVLERAIAMNVDSCEMVVERGDLPAEARNVPGFEEASDGSIDEAASLNGTSAGEANGWFQSGYQNGGTAQNYKGGPVRKVAYHKTYWEDPPQIDVNSLKSQVDWTSDGSCANLSSTYYNTYYGWFSASGWSKSSGSHSGSRACGYATTVSTAKYFNGIFCTGHDIRAHYDGSVSVTGNPNGTYTMTWDIWLETNSALCGNLLSFHRAHGYV